CAVTELESIRLNPATLAGAAIEQPDTADGVGDLCAVRSHVLHGRPACRSGDARQALEPAEPVGQRGDHDVVPHRAGFGAHDVALDGDLCVREQHNGQVGEVVG